MNINNVENILGNLDIQSCAQILGNTCRFNGRYAFSSVATHSVYVSNLLRMSGCSAEIQMCGLLHDLNEILIGDIISPIKPYLMVIDDNKLMGLSTFESDFLKKVFDALGHSDLHYILYENKAIIKNADITALDHEKLTLDGFESKYFLESPQDSRDSFLSKYDALIEEFATNV